MKIYLKQNYNIFDVYSHQKGSFQLLIGKPGVPWWGFLLHTTLKTRCRPENGHTVSSLDKLYHARGRFVVVVRSFLDDIMCVHVVWYGSWRCNQGGAGGGLSTRIADVGTAGIVACTSRAGDVNVCG